MKCGLLFLRFIAWLRKSSVGVWSVARVENCLKIMVGKIWQVLHVLLLFAWLELDYECFPTCNGAHLKDAASKG